MPQKDNVKKDDHFRTRYTNGQGRYLGSSQKGILEEDVILDSSGHYAGSKRKGFFGEELIFDADGHLAAEKRDGVLGTKIILDQEGNYLGTEYEGLGGNKITVLDGGNDKSKSGTGATVALIILAFVGTTSRHLRFLYDDDMIIFINNINHYFPIFHKYHKVKSCHSS